MRLSIRNGAMDRLGENLPPNRTHSRAGSIFFSIYFPLEAHMKKSAFVSTGLFLATAAAAFSVAGCDSPGANQHMRPLIYNTHPGIERKDQERETRRTGGAGMAGFHSGGAVGGASTASGGSHTNAVSRGGFGATASGHSSGS